MSRRGRIVAAVAASVAVGVVVPGAASAHAYLIRTVPAASGVLDGPPPNVQLTYDEAVEPRFAIISVTNAAGRQETTGPVHRSPANPDTLVVPLRPRLPQGWYLIYWRAISVDGHPVQGAFTYAVGPNPGPAPQFPIPSIAGSATSLRLLIARWVMFLSVMSAIGLFVFRVLIARPAARLAPRASLRAVSRAFVIVSIVGVLAIPVYLDIATSIDSLRSAFNLTALVPLFRATAFGRGYVDMLVCFALFCAAAWTALWLDRPERTRRSVAEVISVAGALLAAAAVLLLPGSAGHAAQTSPRGISVALDWLHLDRLAVARGANRTDRPVEQRERLRADWRPVGRRAAVLKRCTGQCRAPAGERDVGDDQPHAGPRRAVADWLRGRDPGKDRAADRRDGARRRQPVAHQTAPGGCRA